MITRMIAMNGLSPTLASADSLGLLAPGGADAHVDAAGIVPEPMRPGVCFIHDDFGVRHGGGTPVHRPTPQVDYRKLAMNVMQLRGLMALVSLTLLAGGVELGLVLPKFISAPSWEWGALLFGGLPACGLSILFVSRQWPRVQANLHASIGWPESVQTAGQARRDQNPAFTIEKTAGQAALGYEGAFRLLELTAMNHPDLANHAIHTIIGLIRALDSPELLPLRLRAMQSLIRIAGTRRDVMHKWEAFAEKNRVIGATIVMRGMDRRDSSGSYFNEAFLFQDDDGIVSHYGELGRQVLQSWRPKDIQLLVDSLLNQQMTLQDLLHDHLQDFEPRQQELLCQIVKQDLVPQSH